MKPQNLELGKITGVFESKEKAEEVFDTLRDRGYAASEIDLVMTDETRTRYYRNADQTNRSEMGDRAMEGAGVGSAIGGTLGAIVGAVAAIGTTLALPGIGLVVAGPLAAALAGAGAGGLTGGLLGALVGSGIPEEHAQEYEERIKEGGTAIAIQPRSAEDAAYIRALFSQKSTGQVYDEHYQSRTSPGTEPREEAPSSVDGPEPRGTTPWGDSGDSVSPGRNPEQPAQPSRPSPTASDGSGKAPGARRPADGVGY